MQLWSPKVANDNNQTSSSNIVNTKVSEDGAWKKRGWLWTANVLTMTSCPKSVNSDIWENKKGTQEYADWRSEHSCSIYH